MEPQNESIVLTIQGDETQRKSITNLGVRLRKLKQKVMSRSIPPPSATTIMLLIIICFLAVINSKLDQKQAEKKYHLKYPIHFIWLGGEVPAKYRIRLESLSYSYKVLTDADWAKYSSKYEAYNLTVIEKADLLRLQYINQFGGIYSDMDNLIDYDCLMEAVAPVRGSFLLSDVQWKFSNCFIFADQPHTRMIKYLLNKTIERVKSEPVPNVRTGPWDFKYWKQLASHPAIDACITHQFDETWNQNSVLINP